MANKKTMLQSAGSQLDKLFTSYNDAAVPAKEEMADKTSHEAGDKKSKKHVFSFRGNEESVKAWRLYAAITGTKVDDLGSAALTEYINNHPLSPAAQALYNERMNS